MIIQKTGERRDKCMSHHPEDNNLNTMDDVRRLFHFFQELYLLFLCLYTLVTIYLWLCSGHLLWHNLIITVIFHPRLHVCMIENKFSIVTECIVIEGKRDERKTKLTIYMKFT